MLKAFWALSKEAPFIETSNGLIVVSRLATPFKAVGTVADKRLINSIL